LVSALAHNSDYATCPAPSADPVCAVRMNKPAAMLILDWIKCSSICSLRERPQQRDRRGTLARLSRHSRMSSVSSEASSRRREQLFDFVHEWVGKPDLPQFGKIFKDNDLPRFSILNILLTAVFQRRGHALPSCSTCSRAASGCGLSPRYGPTCSTAFSTNLRSSSSRTARRGRTIHRADRPPAAAPH
jgi:hypothetical protein